MSKKRTSTESSDDDDDDEQTTKNSDGEFMQDEETLLRWEGVLHQPPIQSYIMSLTTTRDEIFMLFMPRDGSYMLNVYDRNNVSAPKHIIPIPEFHLGDMSACSLSNCVYLLNEDRSGLSIIRVCKDEHQFKVSLWLKHLRLPMPMGVTGSTGLSVSAQSNLIIISRQESPTPTVVGIYDAKGVVQHKIRLSPATYGFKCVGCVIQKADGNLLLTSSDNILSELKLLEIDTSGKILRQYQSSDIGSGVECFEDIYGRLLVNYSGYRIELFDSEFNLLDIAAPQLDDGQVLDLRQLQYNSERHEMVGFRYDWNAETCSLVTLSFTEE